MQKGDGQIKQHIIGAEFYHHGVKGMKWGVIRNRAKTKDRVSRVTSSLMNKKISSISPKQIEKGAKFVSKQSSGIILPKKEYGHVLHELMTNTSDTQKNSDVYSKIIGSYEYKIRNRPGDIPLILSKNKLK